MGFCGTQNEELQHQTQKGFWDGKFAYFVTACKSLALAETNEYPEDPWIQASLKNAGIGYDILNIITLSIDSEQNAY